MSESDQSVDKEINTSTDVLDRDDYVRDPDVLEDSVELYHNNDRQRTENNVPDLEYVPEDSVPENVDVITAVYEELLDVMIIPSDQEVEDHVRQLSPDTETQGVSDQEFGGDEQDGPEEEDSHMVDFLKGFIYAQQSQPKKKDVI